MRGKWSLWVKLIQLGRLLDGILLHRRIASVLFSMSVEPVLPSENVLAAHLVVIVGGVTAFVAVGAADKLFEVGAGALPASILLSSINIQDSSADALWQGLTSSNFLLFPFLIWIVEGYIDNFWTLPARYGLLIQIWHCRVSPPRRVNQLTIGHSSALLSVVLMKSTCSHRICAIVDLGRADKLVGVCEEWLDAPARVTSI